MRNRKRTAGLVGPRERSDETGQNSTAFSTVRRAAPVGGVDTAVRSRGVAESWTGWQHKGMSGRATLVTGYRKQRHGILLTVAFSLAPLFVAGCSKDSPRAAATGPVSTRPYSPPSVAADGKIVATPARPVNIPSPTAVSTTVSSPASPSSERPTDPGIVSDSTVVKTATSPGADPTNLASPENGADPIKSKPTDGFVFVRSITQIEPALESKPTVVFTLPPADIEAIRISAAEQLDVNYVEFGRDDPDVERLVTYVAEIDKEAFRRYYQSLVRSGDRWRFAPPFIESLTITAVEPVDANTVYVSTCELSNVERYRQHDPKFPTDDETVSSGLESTVKRQMWVREQGAWKATIQVERQIFEGENRCEK